MKTLVWEEYCSPKTIDKRYCLEFPNKMVMHIWKEDYWVGEILEEDKHCIVDYKNQYKSGPFVNPEDVVVKLMSAFDKYLKNKGLSRSFQVPKLPVIVIVGNWNKGTNFLNNRIFYTLELPCKLVITIQEGIQGDTGTYYKGYVENKHNCEHSNPLKSTGMVIGLENTYNELVKELDGLLAEMGLVRKFEVPKLKV